ncbi:MAG TPA: hypothetical protein PK748_08475, partial [Acidimicrobiales bacterium]|nr:hypothetical protein [Acidimicrobiales bacterium]
MAARTPRVVFFMRVPAPGVVVFVAAEPTGRSVVEIIVLVTEGAKRWGSPRRVGRDEAGPGGPASWVLVVRGRCPVRAGQPV